MVGPGGCTISRYYRGKLDVTELLLKDPVAPTPTRKSSGDTAKSRACRFCATPFEPRKAGRPQVFCSPACRNKAWGLAAPRKPDRPPTLNNRTKVGNGLRPHLPPRHGGPDMRLRPGRRWNELYTGYLSDLGHPPTAVERALLRQVADLQLASETLSGEIAAGRKCDADDLDLLQRLSGSFRRSLIALGLTNGKGADDDGPASLNDLMGARS